MDVRFLGHACVELSDGDTRVLIDPFLTGNPKAAVEAADVTPSAILLTHGHADHLGDTALFSDMKLVAHRGNAIDAALMCIGGHYTMDRLDAVEAAKFIEAGTVVPCHYDTFPPIETDADAFKSEVESETSSKVQILQPGETHSL